MECVEDGGGSCVASAEFTGEAEGVGDSEAREVNKQGSKEESKDNAYFEKKTECGC